MEEKRKQLRRQIEELSLDERIMEMKSPVEDVETASNNKHHYISENSIQTLLDRAREEWTEELRQAFYDTFYKSGELWFDYIFEDGDTESEQNAKEVVEDYWKEIISKLTTK